MIKCIIGRKGTGKTKQMIELVNEAARLESGNVICIERGQKLIIDITHDARLIDVSAYPIIGYDAFIGFISGIYAQNFDISHIFIDSLYKVVKCEDQEKLEEFIKRLLEFANTNNVKFTISISAELNELPACMAKLI